jgi:hypothetical protein
MNTEKFIRPVMTSRSVPPKLRSETSSSVLTGPLTSAGVVCAGIGAENAP